MKNNKSELRDIYTLKRKNLTYNQILQRSILITRKLLKVPIWDKDFYHIFLTSKKKQRNRDKIHFKYVS